MAIKLSPAELRRVQDPVKLGFTTTEELPKLEGIIGQPRAMEALQFGLDIQDPTFHIYVAGPPGTGRTTAVQSFLEELAREKPTPDDWC